MKTLWIIFFLCLNQSFALELSKRDKTPKSLYVVKNAVGKLKKKDFSKIIRDFVGCCRPSRMVGSPGHAKSIPYLFKTIKELDKAGTGVLTIDEFMPDTDYAIKIYKDDFERLIKNNNPPIDPTYKKWDAITKDRIATFERLRGFKGKNLIWEKRGSTKPEEVLIVGAHFDTIGYDKETMRINPSIAQPGADKNDSGVAVGLALIKLLSQMDIPRTIRIVFFDYEEVGFLGSLAYVRKYKDMFKKEKLVGYINLEMLGNDTKKYDKTKKKNNMKAYIRKPSDEGYQLDLAFANLMIGRGEKVNSRVKFKLSPNGFNASDHIHFWKAGFPAMTFSQDRENDFNKRHHTPNDFVETLNMTTLFNSFQFIAGGVVGWAFELDK